MMKAAITNIITGFLILLFTFTSCREEELVIMESVDDGKNVSLEAYTGEVLDVDYGISIPQYAEVVNTEAEVSSRSLAEDVDGKIHFDYAKMKDVLIHVCLQNGEDVSTRSLKLFPLRLSRKLGVVFRYGWMTLTYS